jgi:hypothetical protein
MVVGGVLSWFDYDGMYVPDLRGMPSHDGGAPELPASRAQREDFGPYKIIFRLVIYISLVVFGAA